MKLHVLSGGRLRVNKGIFTPGRDEGKQIVAPVLCFLIRHPQGIVLFDTGCHPAVAADPAARWGGLARVFAPSFAPGEEVIGELERMGLSPDDVDLVINSHLHMDHCGGNEFFKKATCVVHARELETARDPAMEGKGYFRADWDHARPFRAVEGEHDLFGDGRVVLIPAPGHTPGMMVALVGLDRTGLILLASDTVLMRENLEEAIFPKNTWSAPALLDSLQEVRRWKARGALLVFGHDPEQWASLRKGSDAYE